MARLRTSYLAKLFVGSVSAAALLCALPLSVDLSQGKIVKTTALAKDSDGGGGGGDGGGGNSGKGGGGDDKGGDDNSGPGSANSGRGRGSDDDDGHHGGRGRDDSGSGFWAKLFGKGKSSSRSRDDFRQPGFKGSSRPASRPLSSEEEQNLIGKAWR